MPEIKQLVEVVALIQSINKLFDRLTDSYGDIRLEVRDALDIINNLIDKELSSIMND